MHLPYRTRCMMAATALFIASAAPAFANTVTGTMLPSYSSGSGQIVGLPILPAPKAERFRLMHCIQCNGSAQTGQTFNAATPTALTASGSTTCASYASGYYTPVSFKLLMFVDDSQFPADSYSSASGFSLVATAT